MVWAVLLEVIQALKQYLEISGFEIEGPNANITYSQAIANRTNFVNLVASNPNAQPQKKFTEEGIAIWSGHHLLT